MVEWSASQLASDREEYHPNTVKRVVHRIKRRLQRARLYKRVAKLEKEPLPRRLSDEDLKEMRKTR